MRWLLGLFFGLVGTVVPLRGVPHRLVHRAGERGTVWTETRDSGERILCVAGGADHMDRRVHDFLKREARKDLHKASLAYAQDLGVKVTMQPFKAKQKSQPKEVDMANMIILPVGLRTWMRGG